MSGVLERSLAIIELLARNPAGLTVSAISADLDLPVSAAHRLLNELAKFGYVRQVRSQGEYTLTIKLAALGLGFLGQLGVTDIAQPILDRLARQSGELIRLSVVDGRNLVWVGVSQGATGGLRYDPNAEQGQVVHLACSAGGHAWLSAVSDEEALQMVAEQGLVPPFEPGPTAPRTISELLERLAEDRARGYSVAVDSYTVGMAAMAVPIRHPDDGHVIGCLSIAGPAVRVTPDYMARMAPALQEAADEIALATRASHFFEATQQAAAGRAR
ncbi:IclR family transcriptional regulator [Zhengella mangrovi]|uniref:IclR family transcriptional regulator n=1 Tax=Zhengella mangrovi TaxID=1982044 RepID=A0A2G1QMG6_9HYPH|nr:IclR family transcriptional regulator [Zhengella mangrovi]PHP66682.1 IclR family transcriptional regulator [Zhengella mangrovi]